MAPRKLYQITGNAGVNELLTQVAVLGMVIILAVDELNPVKVFADVLGLTESGIALICFASIILLLATKFSDAVYFSVRIYFNSILSIFFQRVELVGVKNIPMEGPVIFTGNHANQFADGVIVMMTCQRKVGFIIAQKSWEHPVIGFLAKIIGCIPVARPQDLARKAEGSLSVSSEPAASDDAVLVKGQGTHFLKDVKPRDMIRISGKTVKDSGSQVRVTRVIDDVTIEVAGQLKKADGSALNPGEAAQFTVVPHIDQSQMFDEVYKHLATGNCIGIFPEGGSHDRTDLLPLKAGVALMAFGTKENYDISVPVVPVGLNYFRGHRFRARAIVEFGEPIYVTSEDLCEYKKDKREATTKFLDRVTDGMRSVIVTAPDYDTLQGIYLARKLYQQDATQRSPNYIQDMNRRFAEGYRILESKYSDDPVFQDLKSRVLQYRYMLKTLALKDHQVPLVNLFDASYTRNRLIYALGLIVMTALPTLLLNAPVGILARWSAKVEREKALKASSVKIAGRDVMLSRKILVSIVGVPILWIAYAIILCATTSLRWNAIFMLFLAFPLFSYFGVITSEAGMIAVGDLKPLFLRILPSFRSKQNKLMTERHQLKRDLRAYIEAHKEELGNLFTEDKVHWPEFMANRDELLRDDNVMDHSSLKKDQ